MTQAGETSIHLYDGFTVQELNDVFARATYEGLAVTDGERILACNSQFHDMCPTDSSQTLSGCVGVDTERRLTELLSRNHGYSDTLLARHGERWLEFRSRPLRLRDRDGLSVLIVREVTDVVKAQRDLQRAKADLEQFAYVASHDLKSPLRGISNLVTWIRDDLPDEATAEVSEYIDLLTGRVARMEMLLDDLLDFSRAGREQASISTITVVDFLEDVVALLTPPRSFEIDIRAPAVAVQLTPTPLRTVVHNLVHNAMKHHDVDGGRISVKASVDSEELELRLAVEDDGPGIPREYHRKIFQVFETLRPRDEVEGSGIGLALVERLVRHAGGSVSVDSPVDDGRGTRFEVAWPLVGIVPHQGR